jgi:Rrf2 family cysteine metabolism transcriptional repressor
MPLMSRKVDYALLILSHLYHNPEGASAREIAARFGLGRPFVANILKLLCHNGFVASHRGVKGGYVLHCPAEQVRLSDIMESLDDPFRLAECNRSVPEDVCTLTAICPVKHAIAEVHERIREVLRTVTLAELFRPNQHVDVFTTPLGMMGLADTAGAFVEAGAGLK